MCEEEIMDPDDEDYKQELCEQADRLGMESLTEIQQCIVNGEKYIEQ